MIRFRAKCGKSRMAGLGIYLRPFSQKGREARCTCLPAFLLTRCLGLHYSAVRWILRSSQTWSTHLFLS